MMTTATLRDRLINQNTLILMSRDDGEKVGGEGIGAFKAAVFWVLAL